MVLWGSNFIKWSSEEHFSHINAVETSIEGSHRSISDEHARIVFNIL